MIQYLEVLYLYCPVCWKLLNIIRKCKNKVEKCLRILFNILNYLWVILINGNTTYGPTHTQITPTFLVLSQHIFQHSLAVSDKRYVRYFGKCWDEKWISVRAQHSLKRMRCLYFCFMVSTKEAFFAIVLPLNRVFLSYLYSFLIFYKILNLLKLRFWW